MKLCTPAVVYLVLAIIALVLNMRFSMVSILLHVAFIGLWTFILNWICKKGFKWVSWGLVVLPYLFAALVWLIGVEIMAINGKKVLGSSTSKWYKQEGFTEGLTVEEQRLILENRKKESSFNFDIPEINKLTSEQIYNLPKKPSMDDPRNLFFNRDNYMFSGLFEYKDSRAANNFNKLWFIQNIKEIKINNFTPEEIKLIDPSYFREFTQDQISSLNKNQILALTKEQLSAIKNAGYKINITKKPNA